MSRADHAEGEDVDPFKQLYNNRRKALERKAASDAPDAYIARWILDHYNSNTSDGSSETGGRQSQ